MYLWYVEHQNVVFLPLLGMFPYAVAGCFFRYLYLAQQTTQWLLQRNVPGGVVPRPANEGGLTARPGLHGGGLLCGSL